MGYGFVEGNRRFRWHRWFAWHPIWIYAYTKDNGEEIYCRCWWVWIERKGNWWLGGDGTMRYSYRTIPIAAEGAQP